MKDNLSEKMYKEHIMELYKFPDNYGELKNPTHKHTETNSSCGDEITMHLNISNGKIKDVKFHGSGCVMSIVSSSMLASKIKNIVNSKRIGVAVEGFEVNHLHIHLIPRYEGDVENPKGGVRNLMGNFIAPAKVPEGFK